MIAVARRVTLLLFSLLAAASCTLPPVDVDLSVSLASADQMTLRQSFALRRGSLGGSIEPYARAIYYYPSLVSAFDAAAGEPLGYFVIRSDGWVRGFSVTVDDDDPLQLSRVDAELDLMIHSVAADPFHVVHALRAAGDKEKLVLYRCRPGLRDFEAAALATGGSETIRSHSLTDEVVGTPVAAAGAYAPAWPPVEDQRLAALSASSLSGTTLFAERFGIEDPIEDPPAPERFSDSSDEVAQAEIPAVAPECGRVVLARVPVNGDWVTRSYAGFADANRYRTYVAFSGEPEYVPLALTTGRVETVLANGDILTRTSDRWAVWSASGEPRGSFPAGRLHFAHERDLDGTWQAVFTLTYWGLISDDEYLFVKVYTVPSARLRSIR
ncbi:MAG: hypothetical protein EA384_15650 [Spirochaetaceae bacterium]|nr:MAG: hypothetical protein EA384_15650 [Spirochaetaceae bacterium]